MKRAAADTDGGHTHAGSDHDHEVRQPATGGEEDGGEEGDGEEGDGEEDGGEEDRGEEVDGEEDRGEEGRRRRDDRGEEGDGEEDRHEGDLVTDEQGPGPGGDESSDGNPSGSPDAALGPAPAEGSFGRQLADTLGGPPFTGGPGRRRCPGRRSGGQDLEPAEQLEVYVGTHRALQDRLADSGA